eukprot:snap_masked-scaffold_28-processed-gene-2.23-mRNA-1 protein AED:1.00 eAED:1.00 QI:0/0/0/0/1/1/2/0/98
MDGICGFLKNGHVFDLTFEDEEVTVLLCVVLPIKCGSPWMRLGCGGIDTPESRLHMDRLFKNDRGGTDLVRVMAIQYHKAPDKSVIEFVVREVQPKFI